MCTFCVHCGRCAGISPKLVTAGVCPQCKAENDPAADRCAFCGGRLVKAPGQSSR